MRRPQTSACRERDGREKKGGEDGAERRYKVEGWNEPVDEGTANEPAICHNRHQQVEQTLPVPPHIRLWQLNPDCKNLNNQDHAGEFEGDLVCVAPCKRIKQVERDRTEDNAYNRCDRCTPRLAT